VCVRERERDTERERARANESKCERRRESEREISFANLKAPISAENFELSLRSLLIVATPYVYMST